MNHSLRNMEIENQRIDWIMKQDDSKTYPVYLHGNHYEITPSALRKIVEQDKIEITRFQYDLILSRLDAIEKHLNKGE